MSSVPPGPVKNVTVTVSGTTVTCTPSTVDVTAANTMVVFSLTTSGFKFPTTNAIVVTTPNTDFPYASWTMNNTVCGIYDAKGVNGEYKYTCTVVNTSTNAVLELDPIIKNGNPPP